MKMKNVSPLATYIRLSPNCSSPRKAKIDTITPHSVEGDLSVESTLAIFVPTARKASTNYAIGSDGRIGLGVAEEDRAWTSSSSANDNRALTIEIANDSKGPDWHISEKALEAFIRLSVDICTRYGFKGVYWDPNKDNTHRNDGYMRITLHRWFTNKTCPGPYFISRIPDLVEEINRRMAVQSGEYADPTEALDFWVSTGVLNSPDYWIEKCKQIPWLGLAFTKMADYAKKKVAE